jgi:hypothetical protein
LLLTWARASRAMGPPRRRFTRVKTPKEATVTRCSKIQQWDDLVCSHERRLRVR